MEDATSVPGPQGIKVYIVGWCTDDQGMTAAAWASDDGFTWQRVIEREGDAQATGASTDGGDSAVFVGRREDAVPLVWVPNKRGTGFSVNELPAPDGLETWANQVARGLTSFMIVGNAYPNGIEGDTRPVAWLETADGTGWTLIDPPPEASEFVDVADNSDESVGDRFSVLGWTNDFEPAIWDYTPDGSWAMTLLPNKAHDDQMRELVDAGTALADTTIWNLDGGKWTATSLKALVSSADAAEWLQGTNATGLMASGWRWDESGNGYVVFMYSADGKTWTALPDHPEYHGYYPMVALAAMENVMVAISDSGIYLGPIPTP